MRIIKSALAIALVVIFVTNAMPKEAADTSTATAAKSAPAKEPVVIVESAATKDAQTSGPVAIVQQTVVKVLRVLADPKYKDPSERRKLRDKIRSILLDVVDMKNISLLTLANYRSKFSDEQFETFTKLFSQLLFSTYIIHLETYSDEKVVITGIEKTSASRARVKTKTVSSTKEIPIEFGFAKADQKWTLYDVYIEGVSLVKNYRSQFREILLNKSSAQFLERLREKVKENENKL
jgi:phospholipid transport system substrate-binding protein